MGYDDSPASDDANVKTAGVPIALWSRALSRACAPGFLASELKPGLGSRGWLCYPKLSRSWTDLEAWLEKTRSVWSRRLDALERALRAEEEAGARKAKKKVSS